MRSPFFADPFQVLLAVEDLDASRVFPDVVALVSHDLGDLVLAEVIHAIGELGEQIRDFVDESDAPAESSGELVDGERGEVGHGAGR